MDLKRYFIEPIRHIASEPTLIIPAVVPLLVNFALLFVRINIFKAELVLFALFLFIAEFFAHSMLARAVFDLTTQKELNLSEALKVTVESSTAILSAALVIGASAIVGFAVFLIPGLAVLLFSLFAAQEIVINSKGAFDALKGSFEIVRLHFWSVLLYFALILLLIFSISAILNFLLPPILTPFIALLTTPYYAVSSTLLYLDLTEEAKDA